MRKSQYDACFARMKHGHGFSDNKGVGFYYAPALAEMPGVKHGFTARYGGVSKYPFDTLNLSFGRTEPKDDDQNVRRNFEIFCSAADLSYESLCIINFEHGANVVPVTAEDCGRGFGREPLPGCDGLITNDPRVTLISSHADCGAFFLYDPVKRAVGIAHAGWKGTLLRIGRNLVEAMQREYGTDPKDLIASNGPVICKDCYEVDLELGQQFQKEFEHPCGVPGKIGKHQLDMETAAAIQLLEAGVLPEHITLMHECTYENPERLFSHRRNRGKTGDMAGFIKLT